MTFREFLRPQEERELLHLLEDDLLRRHAERRAAPATWSDGSTDHTTRAFDCLADLAAMPLHDDEPENAA